MGSLDWLAFRAKGGAYGAAKVGGRAPVRCSARFASQERRLRRRVHGGYMSSGLSLRAKARRLRRHRTVPVPVPGNRKMTDTSRDYRQTETESEQEICPGLLLPY